MDIIEHNKIKVVSDYLYKTNTNPKTIIKKEMIIEHGFMTMDKEEYKIKKAKEMYEKRLAYIEEEKIRKQEEEEKQKIQKKRKYTQNINIMQYVDEDVEVSCSSEDEDKDKDEDEDEDEDIKDESIDKEMVNLEATYESISYILE
jgi:hypothetical protein